MDKDLFQPTAELSIDFAKTIEQEIDWYFVSKQSWVGREFALAFTDKLDWNLVSQYSKFIEKIIYDDKLKGKIEWRYYARNKHVHDMYKRDHLEKIQYAIWKNGKLEEPKHEPGWCGLM